MATVPSGVTAHSSAPRPSGVGRPRSSKGACVEERRARLGGVGEERAPGIVIAGEVDEQRRGERPVDDEPGIALDLHRPGAVVVDAVAVEGERREAEEQHGIRRDPPPPRDVGRGLLAPGRLVLLAGLHLLAEDGAALLLDRERVGGEDAVAHGGEHEGAGAARLERDVGELGLAAQGIADADADGGSVIRSPANMRRGSGIGGTTPASRGLPSGRSSSGPKLGRK